MHLRPAEASDMAAIAALYKTFVDGSTITFETDAPDDAEMVRRWRALVDGGYPYLVAIDKAGTLQGYAYCGPFRTRAAYRFCAENSVYIAPGARRGGLGRALMEEILTQSASAGITQVLAVITDTQETAASLAFHEALGFRRVGTLEKVGHKFDQWLDVALLQRSLVD